jgi:hypothetical protein
MIVYQVVIFLILIVALWGLIATPKRNLRPMRKTRFEQLEDVTESFLTMLANEKNYFRSSPKMLISGAPSAGKTTLNLLISNEMMENDDKCKFAIFGASDNMLELFQKKCPWGDRVYRTSRLSKVKNNSIFDVDEAFLTANAKQAFQSEMIALGQAATFMSHKKIKAVLNAQDEGILKDLRLRCDILIYKQNTFLVLNDAIRADPIMHEFHSELENLPQEKSIIFSSYKQFKCRRGLLVATKEDLDRAIPWFDEDFSVNLSKESLDIGLQKDLESEGRELKLIESAIRRFGAKAVCEQNFQRFFLGYLRDDVSHRDVYREFQPKFKQVYPRMYYKAKLAIAKKREEEDEDVVKKIKMQIAPPAIPSANPQVQINDFPSYVEKYLANFKINSKLIQVVVLYLQKFSQPSIVERLHDKEIKIGVETVNDIIRDFQEGMNDFVKTPQGNLYEEYFDFSHPGGMRGGGNTDSPDWIGPFGGIEEKPVAVKNGEIWSLKCRAKIDAEIKYYLDKDNRKNGLGPECREAKKRGLDHVWLAQYNPWWRDHEFFKRIDLPESLEGEYVLVRRSTKRKPRIEATPPKPVENAKVTYTDVEGFLKANPDYIQRLGKAAASVTMQDPTILLNPVSQMILPLWINQLKWEGPEDLLKALIILYWKALGKERGF